MLANIALHGLETTIKNAIPRFHGSSRKGEQVEWSPTVIRFADDFVVLHRDLQVIRHIQQVAADWLKPMGLELSLKKTQISHTLNPVISDDKERVGFDFLGFTIRQFRVGNSRRLRSGFKRGYKTIIRPSEKSVKKHYAKLKQLSQILRGKSQRELIDTLNPVIKGWTNYFRTTSSSWTFNKLRYMTYRLLRRWAVRRQSKKDHTRWKLYESYFHPSQGKWQFSTDDGWLLFDHSETHIIKHIKVKDVRSPFDRDWVYWASRMARHPLIDRDEAILLKRQQGRCPVCEQFFMLGDKIDADHIVPVTAGGRKGRVNQQLLHQHCHQQKTSGDGSHQGKQYRDRTFA